MIKTTYQKPEIRDANDNIIQQGAFGKNTALANSTNDGWIDYVMNDLEALHDTIGDSAPTLDGNGHVVEPANLAIGDEDGVRLKTGYLKTSGGTVSGTLNIAQNLRMQDNQENVFGGMYVPASSATSQYLQLYGGETPSNNGGNLQLPSDGSWTLQAKNGSTAYNLVGGTDGTLKWRGNNVAVTASPAFTGTPTAPTQSASDNSTKLATTAWARNAIKTNALAITPEYQTTIQSGDDLDNYVTPGAYRCTSSAVASSLENCPYTSSNFLLLVLEGGGTAYKRQIIYATSVGNLSTYYRNRDLNGTWGSWKKVAFAQDVLPLTGGTLTGTIESRATTPFRCRYNETIGETPSNGRDGYVFSFVDSNGTAFGGLYNQITTAGNTAIRLFSNHWSDNALRGVTLYCFANDTVTFYPNNDNSYTLGDGSHRWKQLYAGTTTISTSDERLKDNIVAIPDEVLDAWGEVNWYQYQFKDSIAEKGETKARIHTGAIAQRIESVFESHGLDANKYGLLCYDEWKAEPAERDEQGNIVQEARPAGNRYSLRYEEALCMEAAYQRRRADRLEERIARLEALLN